MTHCAGSCSDSDCDFYVFLPFFSSFSSSRRAVEQDKLKRTVLADRGDEATLGKSGIKNGIGERVVGEDCSFEC